jgi:hypothetical protein
VIPQSQPRQRRNNSKINLLISLAFHVAIVLALTYLAAREGLLGKELKKIAVEMVKEEVPKPKEPEPEKPREVEPPPTTPTPTPEIPVVEAPRPVATPPPPAAGVAAPPPVAPPAAPPAAELPSFVFEGGKAVQTTADPIQLYKGLIEYTIRSRWERPADVEDEKFVAELEISVDRSGTFSAPNWKRTSGHAEWDASVRRALAATPGINRAPPTNFPTRVTVRFDVEGPTEPILP